MKLKLYFSLVIAALFIIASCSKDASVYLSQDKKDVAVDVYDTTGNEGGGSEGNLLPGINLVKLKVSHNGLETERRFKYFMPVSIDKSRPISLIFDFHGSYGAGADPLAGVSMSHPLSQLAIKQNCIIVTPAGEDTGSAVNWQNSDLHLPFVDAMVAYFKNHSPVVDMNRIYTCGHSSGAIFSFVLAYERSEVFAAAVPVAGQMKLSATDPIPSRAVPIRAFNGVTDDIVIHAAAKSNITAWANQVAGYFPSDGVLSDTLKIDNYKSYLTTKWNGGKADIELYSVIDEGHGVSWYNIMPLMWEFMQSHPKNVSTSGSYFSSEIKSFDAMEGQSFNSEIRHTIGATVSLVSYPSDWTVSYSNNVLKVKAPNDFFSATTINRKGSIKMKITHNGVSQEIALPYSLKAPKAFYEVGDVVYDSDYKPMGVVCWVNTSNIKEAKIIALEGVKKKFGPVGTTFFTPSKTDGYSNTQALVARNNTLTPKLTAATSAFIYAYEYKASSGTTSGWYLPAVDELKSIDENLTELNKALKIHGTPLELVVAASSSLMSSTMINDGGKKFYTFNFNNNAASHGYNIVAAKSDDTGFFMTRPIKKVSK